MIFIPNRKMTFRGQTRLNDCEAGCSQERGENRRFKWMLRYYLTVTIIFPPIENRHIYNCLAENMRKNVRLLSVCVTTHFNSEFICTQTCCDIERIVLLDFIHRLVPQKLRNEKYIPTITIHTSTKFTQGSITNHRATRNTCTL
jgi:hypothetical protein